MGGEDEVCSRISDKVKMAGFLEKKGKMKLVSPWRKYWFVLEDRLLLYYKSQLEYIKLSPCRGSLNMGLVSTVRPGSADGPCIIHVITRSQVVQLRAKDRAVQEEWMQALLDSMAIPVIATLIAPVLNGMQYNMRYSMDSIPTAEQMKEQEERDKQKTLPNRLNTLRGTHYGGSLDTAIWSHRLQVRSPSPNIPKGRMLEKVLGYVEEIDTGSGSGTSSPHHSLTSLARKSEGETPTHDENQNHDYYSTVDKTKTRNSRTNSGSDVQEGHAGLHATKSDEKTRFERIKSVISRKGKDKKTEKGSEEDLKVRPVKKKRSFLNKVFKKHYKKREPAQDDETDSEDPMYDTIANVQENKQHVVQVAHQGTTNPQETPVASPPCQEKQPIYSQVQKPVFGSKSLLTAQAMSELKNKLKSRDSLERQDIELNKPKQDDLDSELAEAFSRIRRREEENCPPALPPRRNSISPWHDVPENNTLITLQEPCHDEIQIDTGPEDKGSPADNDSSEMPEEEDHNETEALQNGATFTVTVQVEEGPSEPRQDDLVLLLAQLTEITQAPLTSGQPMPVLKDKMATSDLELDLSLWAQKPPSRRPSDPDYDTPRPHQPLNLTISDDIDKITATAFLGGADDDDDDDSESSCSPSMEPDSLEAVTKSAERNDLLLCGL